MGQNSYRGRFSNYNWPRPRFEFEAERTDYMKVKPDLKRGLPQTLLGFALFLLPLGANALDFTLDASRILSDPSYLPLGGQLYGSTEYSYGNTSSNTNNSIGALKSTNTTLSNTVNEILEFGVTRDFSLRVSDSYQWTAATASDPNGANTSTHSNGFIDPTFEAICRVLDQKDHPISWDLLATYAPNLLNAQSADPTENGTVARGGDTETFGTAISQKTKDFTFYLEGTLTYLNSRSVFNPSNNITTNYDASWQYFLNASTQTRFNSQWSLNLTASETFNDSANAFFINSGGTLVNSINQPGEVTTLTSALNFQAIPNRCVLSFIYSHYFYDNISNLNQTFPGNSTTTNEKGQDIFSGELRYVFN